MLHVPLSPGLTGCTQKPEGTRCPGHGEMPHRAQGRGCCPASAAPSQDYLAWGVPAPMHCLSFLLGVTQDTIAAHGGCGQRGTCPGRRWTGSVGRAAGHPPPPALQEDMPPPRRRVCEAQGWGS